MDSSRPAGRACRRTALLRLAARQLLRFRGGLVLPACGFGGDHTQRMPGTKDARPGLPAAWRRSKRLSVCLLRLLPAGYPARLSASAGADDAAAALLCDFRLDPVRAAVLCVAAKGKQPVFCVLGRCAVFDGSLLFPHPPAAYVCQLHALPAGRAACRPARAHADAAGLDSSNRAAQLLLHAGCPYGARLVLVPAGRKFRLPWSVFPQRSPRPWHGGHAAASNRAGHSGAPPQFRRIVHTGNPWSKPHAEASFIQYVWHRCDGGLPVRAADWPAQPPPAAG